MTKFIHIFFLLEADVFDLLPVPEVVGVPYLPDDDVVFFIFTFAEFFEEGVLSLAVLLLPDFLLIGVSEPCLFRLSVAIKSS